MKIDTQQHTATHCNTLQRTATHCNALQRTATHCSTRNCITLLVCSGFALCCTTSQYTATHCNTLQHTATHCNTLQHTATHCNMLQHTATHCNTLQHTATHCNKLHHTATNCITLQHAAAHGNTLQHTATHCNTLQHTATHATHLWLARAPHARFQSTFPQKSSRYQRYCVTRRRLIFPQIFSEFLPEEKWFLSEEKCGTCCLVKILKKSARCYMYYVKTRRANFWEFSSDDMYCIFDENSQKVRSQSFCMSHIVASWFFWEFLSDDVRLLSLHGKFWKVSSQRTAKHCNTLQHTATHLWLTRCRRFRKVSSQPDILVWWKFSESQISVLVHITFSSGLTFQNFYQTTCGCFWLHWQCPVHPHLMITCEQTCENPGCSSGLTFCEFWKFSKIQPATKCDM